MDVSSGLTCAYPCLNTRCAGSRALKGAQAGFTLIELMIVVVVIGIFAAIALPSFSSVLNRMSVRAAADEFYSLLQYSRAEAVTRGTTINISAAVGTTNIIVKAGNTTLRQVGTAGLQAGVAINSDVNSVNFTPTGTASTNACFQIVYPTNSSVAAQYIALLTSGRITAPSTTKPSGC